MTDLAKKKPLLRRPFTREFIFLTSKSSGPGGQHVNKTETRVELRFHIQDSALLSEAEKETLSKKLERRINSEGYLVFYAQEHRSQIMNKKLAEKRFYQHVSKALERRKKRIPTKPTGKSVEKRMIRKRHRSEIKVRRSGIRNEPPAD